MTAPGYRFVFSYESDEVKEALRFSRAVLYRRSHPRLIRGGMMLLLLPVAGVFGFAFAPYEIGPLSFDSEMSIAAICFFAAAAGIFMERIATRVIFQRMYRPYQVNHARERVVTIDPAGAQEEVADGRRLGFAWTAITRVALGRTILAILSPGGEWLAVPLRLLSDGPAALERDIAAWRAAA